MTPPPQQPNTSKASSRLMLSPQGPGEEVARAETSPSCGTYLPPDIEPPKIFCLYLRCLSEGMERECVHPLRNQSCIQANENPKTMPGKRHSPIQVTIITIYCSFADRMWPLTFMAMYRLALLCRIYAAFFSLIRI